MRKEVVAELLYKLPKFDSYSHYNWLPFYWHGYEANVGYTYVIINLLQKSEDEIFKNFNSSYRSKIKKAKKNVEKVYQLKNFMRLI
jgi:lipid II:glycine glycyltransferase (peptidoglycan interpeptide bridge formation enzyme)